MSTRTQQIPTSLTVTRAEKCTKLKTAGTELLRQRIQESGNVNSPSPPTISTNNSYPSRPPSQKTKIAAPTFWGKGRRGANTIEESTNRYEEDFMTECNEEPTQEWQRRWNVGMILQYNARYPDDPKPLPYWITHSPDINDANSKVQCQNRKPTGFIFTMKDYCCDPWDQPTIYDANALSFKIQITNPQEHPEAIPHFPPLIVKKSNPTPRAPVTITSRTMPRTSFVSKTKRFGHDKHNNRGKLLFLPHPRHKLNPPLNYQTTTKKQRSILHHYPKT